MTSPDTGAWTPEQFLDIAITACSNAGQPARRPEHRYSADAIEHAYRLMTLFGVPVADFPDDLTGDEEPYTGPAYRLDTTDENGAVYAVTYADAADDEAALAAGFGQLRTASDGHHVRVYGWDGYGNTRLIGITARDEAPAIAPPPGWPTSSE